MVCLFYTIISFRALSMLLLVLHRFLRSMLRCVHRRRGGDGKAPGVIIAQPIDTDQEAEAADNLGENAGRHCGGERR